MNLKMANDDYDDIPVDVRASEVNSVVTNFSESKRDSFPFVQMPMPHYYDLDGYNAPVSRIKDWLKRSQVELNVNTGEDELVNNQVVKPNGERLAICTVGSADKLNEEALEVNLVRIDENLIGKNILILLFF